MPPHTPATSATSSPSSRSTHPRPAPTTPPQLDDGFLARQHSPTPPKAPLKSEAVHTNRRQRHGLPALRLALASPEGLEEERRLFYVALTRARRTLAIYIFPVRYYHHPNARDDIHGYGKTPRFLTDSAEALCDQIDAIGDQQSAPLPMAVINANVKVDLSRLWT